MTESTFDVLNDELNEYIRKFVSTLEFLTTNHHVHQNFRKVA